VLTGLFWLANLVGSCYGEGFFFRSVVEVLILLMIAITRVVSPYFFSCTTVALI
jgi:hypothetical protein